MSAPAEVSAPSAGLLWRPATIDDVDALTALQRAMDAVDHPSYAATREEIEEELTHSYVDLAVDTLVGFDGAAAVAYGTVTLSPGQETLVRSLLGGGVHPSHRGRGIGRELLAWQESRALQQLASSDKTLPGWIMAYAEERSTESLALIERAGFAKTRWFLAQQRVLSEEIPDVAAAPGITIERFTPELSEATHRAKNAAFRDHWGSQPTTDEQWESMVGMEAFRASDSFVALSPAGDVVGFLITLVVEDDWDLQGYSSGYMALIGTVREWRRKGIAPALITRAFRAYREAGYERAELDVDTDNPSGALGLYQRLGFVETTRSIALTKVF